jgi:NAD(P)H-dependent FMN reductase
VAICGSTRQSSTNLSLIYAITELTKNDLNITIYNHINSLPHFNPDNDNGKVNEAVIKFREQLKTADGILICTPEYAMGLPGTLKNALDWTVSSCEFSKKPVMAITASSMGEKAHQSLLGTLNILEAKVKNLDLLISFAKTKISTSNKITDEFTLNEIKLLISKFIKVIEDND